MGLLARPEQTGKVQKLPSSMSLYRLPGKGVTHIKGVSSSLKTWIKSRSSYFKLRGKKPSQIIYIYTHTIEFCYFETITGVSIGKLVINKLIPIHDLLSADPQTATDTCKIPDTVINLVAFWAIPSPGDRWLILVHKGK